MAVAFYGVASSTSAIGTSPITFAHTVGANTDRCLVVTAGGWRSGGWSISGITYDGVALTKVDHNQNVPTEDRVELWILLSPNVGTANVSITLAAAAGAEIACGATNWSGVSQTTPTGAAAKAVGNSTDVTVDVASGADQMVVDIVTWFNQLATAGGGQTSRWEQENGAAQMSGAHSSEPGAATTTMSWTLDGARDWTTMGVPLLPTGGGGGGGSSPLFLPLRGCTVLGIWPSRGIW
jgi:hypothetical protein